MSKVDKLTRAIKDQIDALIGDRSISWDLCCDALEDIEDHAGEWARQIRRDHEGESDD